MNFGAPRLHYRWVGGVVLEPIPEAPRDDCMCACECVHTCAHGTLERSLPHRSVGGRGGGRRGRSWLPCSTKESALQAGPTAGGPAGHPKPGPSPHPDAGRNPQPSWSESIPEACPGASRVLPAPRVSPLGGGSPQDVRGRGGPCCVSLSLGAPKGVREASVHDICY